jgi:aminopeptidase N
MSMKVSSLLFAMLCFPIFLGAQNHEHDELVCKEMHTYAQMAEARGAGMIEDLSFDLKYCRLDWKVDPNVKAITGKASSVFEVKKDGMQTMEFNLSTQLIIDSIVYHGNLITYTQMGNYGLTVNLPQPLALGQTDSVSIVYHGVPPTTGFGSFNKNSHAGVPIVWTLSAPFGAQDWWPCKNGLTDKIDSLDVFITTPSQYRAASAGLLVSETVVGTEATYHWKHRYPIAPYLVCLAVTNYVQYTDIVPLANGIQMPMLNYVYPESLNAAKVGTANLVQVLQFFDSLFVPYPFYAEKYGHAQFGWGGGMEHQTMSFVTDYSFSLLAHELAHQWFGDAVTCGSWEDVWINEGSATYLEGLSQERFQSPTTWLNWKKGKVNNITSGSGGSVRVDDTTSVNRIFSSRLTYNKGAYLLHMLRWKLGDDAFFAGTRAFLADKQYSYAKTASFKAFLEQASGQNLTEFFKDWYEGQGYPKYTVTWSQDATNKLVLKIEQTQSNASVSFFEMPVPIKVIGAGQDTVLRFEHQFSGQNFSAQLPFAVTSVAFDPEYWLISANNKVNQGIVATNELQNEIGTLKIQPNPVRGNLAQLSIVSNASGKALITVQNAEAKTVYAQNETLVTGENQFELQLPLLASGVYQVQVQTQSGVLNAKMTLVE